MAETGIDWDHYDNGPGSESHKRRMAEEQRKFDSEMWEQRRADEEELQQLRAIVAKLPMCWQFNDDKTALVQTCPVVPGMTVFAVRRGCVVDKHRVVEFEVYVIDPSSVGDCDRLGFQAADCFATRAAAEVTKQAEKGSG